MRAQKAQSHARGYGGMLPRIFFFKNGAIRCILVHSRVHFSLQNFSVFEFFFCFLNVAFADKSENKEKEELWRLQMRPYLYRSGFKEKKFQVDLNFGPRGIDLTRYRHMSTAM